MLFGHQTLCFAHYGYHANDRNAHQGYNMYLSISNSQLLPRMQHNSVLPVFLISPMFPRFPNREHHYGNGSKVNIDSLTPGHITLCLGEHNLLPLVFLLHRTPGNSSVLY